MVRHVDYHVLPLRSIIHFDQVDVHLITALFGSRQAQWPSSFGLLPLLTYITAVMLGGPYHFCRCSSNVECSGQSTIGAMACVLMQSLHGLLDTRSRSSTVVESPKAGDICYFYRMSKYNSRTAPSKRKLSLRRWHGPALVVALEGSSNAYLSFKGQLTKFSLEHV